MPVRKIKNINKDISTDSPQGRLKSWVYEKYPSAAVFASELGINPRFIYPYLRDGGSIFGAKYRERLKELGLDVGWYLTGRESDASTANATKDTDTNVYVETVETTQKMINALKHSKYLLIKEKTLIDQKLIGIELQIRLFERALELMNEDKSSARIFRDYHKGARPKFLPQAAIEKIREANSIHEKSEEIVENENIVENEESSVFNLTSRQAEEILRKIEEEEGYIYASTRRISAKELRHTAGEEDRE